MNRTKHVPVNRYRYLIAFALTIVILMIIGLGN